MTILERLIGFVIGLFIGLLIGRVIVGKIKVGYHGPNSKDIVKNVYEDADGKCYKFVPKIHLMVRK